MSGVLPLVGRRVVVRRFEASDAGALRRYRDDADTASLQGWDVPYTAAQAEAFVTWAARAPMGVAGEWCQVALEWRTQPGLVGDIGIHTLADRPACVEIGVTVDPGERGSGVATEGVTLVLDHLREHLGIERAQAWIDVRNLASAALFERLGFACVATERAPDGSSEHHYERPLLRG